MSNGLNLAATALAGALETAIGAAVALDALGMDRLAGLSGRRIRFRCAAPEIDHTWIVGADRILIATADTQPVDVEIEGPFPALARLLLRPDQPAGPELTIDGDTQVLDALLVALGTVRPDLAPVLEPALGGDAAAGADAIVGAVLRSAREAGDLAAAQLQQGLGSGNLGEAVGAGLRNLAAVLRQPPTPPDEGPGSR